jgi:hypothetical protein
MYLIAGIDASVTHTQRHHTRTERPMAERATVRPLYEVVDLYAAILAEIEDREEEILAAGGVLPADLAERMDEREGNLTEKVRRIALVIRNQESLAKGAEDEITRLKGIAKSYRTQADALKRYLMDNLQRAGSPKIETSTAKVWIQANGRPSISPIGEIPAEYQRIRVEFDGTAAYEDAKASGAIPEAGESLEWHGLLVERGVHLRIK